MVSEAKKEAESGTGHWELTERCKAIMIPQLRLIMIDNEVNVAVADALAARLAKGELDS